MRSIAYIVLAFAALLVGCGKSGTKVQVLNVNLDSVFYSPKLPQQAVANIDLRIANHSASSASFYITPAQYDFGTYHALVSSILSDTATNQANAIKLWQFMKDYTSHSKPLMDERIPHDPLRLVASFQSGLCDDRNAALAKLFTLAGYQARVWHLDGHVVAEVYYDRAWHMFDADWGMYCMNGNTIADVAYISTHPSVIKLGDEYAAPIRNYVGPAILKYVYASTYNNYVNTWYDDVQLNYNSTMQLHKGDELSLHVQRMAWEGKLRKLVAEHSITGIRQWGTLQRNVHAHAQGAYVYTEYSPYAVNKVSVQADVHSQAVWLYYSVDGVAWHLKGMLGGGNANVTFTPTDSVGEDKVFGYKLKFEPVDGTTIKQQYAIRNSILFSGRMLLNKGGGFRVIPIGQGASLQLQMDAIVQ
jgi:hypothetical protein